jgi:glutamyl-tRNA reductase
MQKMLHGAFAELHAADAGHREEVANALSRLFLRQSARNPGDVTVPEPRHSDDKRR